jgi:hypothetical protein
MNLQGLPFLLMPYGQQKSGFATCFIDIQALRARAVILSRGLTQEVMNCPSIPYKLGVRGVEASLQEMY